MQTAKGGPKNEQPEATRKTLNSERKEREGAF